MKRLYIAGTRPGAGKTTVARALARGLTNRGLRVAVMKPVETGCELAPGAGPAPLSAGGMPGPLDPQQVEALARLERIAGPPPAPLAGRTPASSLRPRDAQLLLAAARRELPLEQVCPYRYAPALEPAVCARAREEPIELSVISRHFSALAAEADHVIVEGTAGLMAPLNSELLMVDLVRELELSVLLVGPCSVGVVNDVLLNLELLRARGIEVLGVVLRRGDSSFAPEEAANPLQIEEVAGPLVRGTLPHFTAEQLADDDVLAQRLRVHSDLLDPPGK